MNKVKQILSVRTIVLIAAAALAFVLAFTGTARAALTYFSADYAAEFALSELEVSLLEKGEGMTEAKDVSGGELLTWFKNSNDYSGPVASYDNDSGEFTIGGYPDSSKDNNFTHKLGYGYTEELSAQNTGDYDEYVRVVIEKSWKDSSGKKDTTLNPSLIDLNIVGEGTDWVRDPNLETDEQIVLYSKRPLSPGEVRAFVDTLTLKPELTEEPNVEVTESEEDSVKVTKTTYTYNDKSFSIRAEVDAVQTHNAAKAINSAWGIDPSIIDPSLTLEA